MLHSDSPDDLPRPEEPCERERELAILREAYADAQAGRGVEARAFLKEIALKYNLPLEPGE